MGDLLLYRGYPIIITKESQKHVWFLYKRNTLAYRRMETATGLMNPAAVG